MLWTDVCLTLALDLKVLDKGDSELSSRKRYDFLLDASGVEFSWESVLRAPLKLLVKVFLCLQSTELGKFGDSFLKDLNIPSNFSSLLGTKS